jgi:uncharacterized iron-regulated protein
MKRKNIFIVMILLLSVVLGHADEEEDILLLKIGDNALKEKAMTVFPDKIYSAKSGKSISFAEMIQDMAQSRFVYVGETHNSLPMHLIQARIIQGLYEKDRHLSVGMEMYPVTEQEALRKWHLGILSEEEFIRDARWYENWNFNFGYYRHIFEVVKQNTIPLYALNVSQDIISKVRMKGWEALSEEEKGLVPEPDLTQQDHRALIHAIFASSDLPPQMKGKGMEMVFEGLYRAQTAWDETMARYALDALDKEGGKIVVLAGSGHLLYNLGINLRAYNKSRMPFKTVICVVIPEGEESIQVSRSLADFVWGLPEEEQPVYPSVGLQFKQFEGLTNLVIERDPIDGVAKGKDFKKGDVVLSVDGQKFSDVNILRIYMAKFSWGDRVKFQLLRNAQQIESVLEFLVTEDDPEKL